MLAEVEGGLHFRGEGFDVFELAFRYRGEHVARPLLDEREEGAVSEWAVGPAETECVREGGHADAEVRGYPVGRAPEVAQVSTVRDEGEAREPGGVEAGCTDDDVDRVCSAGVVDEAVRCDARDGVGEDSRVRGDKGFKVTWCWGWTATTWIEVFGDHFFGEIGILVEFFAHFRVCILTGELGFWAAFDDEFEALVEFVLDLFAVF